MGCSVREFLDYEANDDNMPKLFYNMSNTMKYIHNHDYYVKSLNPSEIDILDTDALSPIQYKKLDKIETEEDRQNINSNIHTLALMQLGAYSRTLDNFNAKFAEENFNEFELFIPENDTPYLRGTVQRNSPVYYCDFVNERNQREIEKLDKELGGNPAVVGGMTKSKATSVGRAMTDKETEKLYRGLDDKQAAFTTFLILPLTMILLGIILSIITLIIH